MNRSSVFLFLVVALLVAGGTLLRADGILTIAVGDTSATEDTGQATFPVTLSCAMQSPVEVAYTTVDGTATAPGDYTETAESIKFPQESPRQFCSFPIIKTESTRQ